MIIWWWFLVTFIFLQKDFFKESEWCTLDVTICRTKPLKMCILDIWTADGFRNLGLFLPNSRNINMLQWIGNYCLDKVHYYFQLSTKQTIWYFIAINSGRTLPIHMPTCCCPPNISLIYFVSYCNKDMELNFLLCTRQQR